jgi:outer membrane protein TolC
VQYQNVVLQANAEAENAIVSFLKAQQQVKSLQESVAAAKESLALVSLQYSNGKVDFNRVFIVQVFLTQQQDQLAVAQGAVAQSLIQLYRALGGGWQIRLNQFYSPPPAAPERPAVAVPVPDPAPAPPAAPADEQT